MDVQQLQSTAQALVAEGKGILAADESSPSCPGSSRSPMWMSPS